MLSLLLAAQLTTFKAVGWEYPEVAEVAEKVSVFLVCLDGQPTPACISVPTSSGVLIDGVNKTYKYILPPLLVGTHRVALQACTDGLAQCSDGVSLQFSLSITNPVNLRLIK